MHEFVSFNHRIYHPLQVNLPAVSSAAFYGKGVFTTLAVCGGQPFLWEKHWARLTENAARLSIDISDFSENQVRESFQNLIAKNRAFDSRARLTFFDESSGEIWKTENRAKSSLLIATADNRNIAGKLALGVSPYAINSSSPLVNIKSCNYLENICAFREAKTKEFDEAIRLNEKGKIVSACLANVFWVRNEAIFTPALETGALRGTTRDFIMEHFEVSETVSSFDELAKADAVFITSSGIGVAEVKTLESIEYRSINFFNKIKKLFDQFRESAQD